MARLALGAAGTLTSVQEDRVEVIVAGPVREIILALKTVRRPSRLVASVLVFTATGAPVRGGPVRYLQSTPFGLGAKQGASCCADYNTHSGLARTPVVLAEIICGCPGPSEAQFFAWE